MLNLESISYWITVLILAFSFGLFTIGLIFRKEASLTWATRMIYIAFFSHTLAIVSRWIYSGHPPFVTFFESMSASVWFGILAFLILRERQKQFQVVGITVVGISFLLLAWAATPTISGTNLAVGLKSAWLFVHATFATAAVGLFIVAAGIGSIWLWKLKNNEKDNTIKKDIPSPQKLDETVTRFILSGFLFYTIMLLSGAIWANNAWGRYWAWDPIEIWSLISWVYYGLYLHLHFTFPRFRGRLSAWAAIAGVLFAAFSLWGVGYVYNTIHNYG